MNITKESVDALNAVIKIKVGPEDYLGKVEKTLKEHQKKASMPGFRPGKVPAGMIRKMYGKSVLADELNRILGDSLYSFIQEQKLDILGNPLPKEDNQPDLELDGNKEFEFRYDLALQPDFKVELSDKDKHIRYTIQIDEPLLAKYSDDIARRYGQIATADTTEEHDLVYGDFVELDAAGEILPGGIFKASTLYLERLSPEKKTKLVGLKAGDKATLDPSEISENPAELATKLGITPEQVSTLTSKFQFTVKSINRLAPAELNQELFDKIYGPGIVNSPEEFRAKLRDELGGMFKNDSETRLKNDIIKSIINKTQFSLPDNFLKRWMLAVSKTPATAEQIDMEYDQYRESLRWQLIENKIYKDNKIAVTNDEAIEYVKGLVRVNYEKSGRSDMNEEELEMTAKRVLEKEEEAKRVFETLYQQKMMALFNSILSFEDKAVSYEEFTALA
ncbi:MAG: trigger factor [Bacteroidia bacterium]